MVGTPGVNSYFLMSWSLFLVGQLLFPIYMASRPICTWTIYLVKKKKVFCLHLVLIKNEYIIEACLLSASSQKQKYRMWDPTRVGMAERKPWHHQFSTLMPSLGRHCLSITIITPPFSTWLRFNSPISLYMYCRQTVSSLLSWKPRGQLFTHVSYRLSPRSH